MYLPAKKTGDECGYPDEQLIERLPIVAVEGTVGVDVFLGERVPRPWKMRGALSPSPFLEGRVKVFQAKKCKDSCRVFKYSRNRGWQETPYGSYLAGCVLYATIFGVSPEGLPYQGEDLMIGVGATPMPQDAIVRLQTVAWRIVADYPFAKAPSP